MAEHDSLASIKAEELNVSPVSGFSAFYQRQEKKILGTAAVVVFLVVWELVGGVWQLVNPMFLSAPSQVWLAAVKLAESGELWLHIRVSGYEFVWGYLISVAVGVPLG